MLYKANRKNDFECHLQAYLLQNFDNEPIKSLLLPKPWDSCWIGNEVSCGVGMQCIDIMVKQETDMDVYIKIIELKCTEPHDAIKQIPWYIEWVKDYVAPNYLLIGKRVDIIPSIIGKETSDTNFLSNVENASYTGIEEKVLIKTVRIYSI